MIINPTSRRMGQQVAEGLLQKAIARLIHQWALVLDGKSNSPIALRQ